MKRFLIPTLVLIYSLQNSAFATNCSEINLTDPDYLRSIGKEGLVTHFKEPRDQDSVGWCGSYASSDALSFAVGEPVSALDISINQYANKNARNIDLSSLDGITPNAASNVAMTNGYCPESIIPSNITASSNLGQVTLKALMASFQRLSQDFKARGKPNDFCVKCADQEYERVIKPALPNVNEKMIQEVLIKNEGDSLASLRDLMKKLCNGNRVKIKPNVKTYRRGGTGGKSFASIFNDALENNSLPAIGISAGVFTNFTNEPHEMVIIGRKPGRNGKCQYIIRNSWGRGCGFYKEEFADTCDASKGTFVMDEDQLQASIADVLIIKNESGSGSRKKAKPVSENTSDNTIENPKPNQTLRKGKKLPQNEDSQEKIGQTQQSRQRKFTQKTTPDNSINADNTQLQPDSQNSFGRGLGNFLNSLWNGIASFFKF